MFQDQGTAFYVLVRGKFVVVVSLRSFAFPFRQNCHVFDSVGGTAGK